MDRAEIGTPRGLKRRASLCALAALVWGLFATTSALAAEIAEAVSYCLACHGSDGLSMVLEDGSEMSLFQDGEVFQNSVHGAQLLCTDCHEGYEEDHPSGATFASQRAYAIASYEVCKKCHFDTYARTLESVHYEHLKDGLYAVPVCTDCHGAHDIQNPHEKRAMISRSCGSCHAGVYETYARSVHGKALVEGDNQDVPACAGCHTAHSIEHPTTIKFHLASPQICIGCHADEELAARYDIPTTVATTYLSDFHGVTASLASASDVEERHLVVTCVDCHGVHDIASPRLVGRQTMKAKVAKVCTGCHEGAATDFPAAWLSHFQPSLEHAPIVFFADLFYKIFIPFVISGLILQVLLHLYRVATRR
jgi:predicted CXXCH cytochrome family protein